ITPIQGHGYDHITLNPSTGTVYMRQYGTAEIWQYPIGGPWSLKTTWASRSGNIADGVAWWTGPLMGAGPQGALIAYDGGWDGGGLLAWDPLTDTWFMNQSGFGGVATYHGFAEYSAVHNVAICGGGNANARKVWRLNMDQSITSMSDAPV